VAFSSSPPFPDEGGDLVGKAEVEGNALFHHPNEKPARRYAERALFLTADTRLYGTATHAPTTAARGMSARKIGRICFMAGSLGGAVGD
jgi:hypothetical protein